MLPPPPVPTGVDASGQMRFDSAPAAAEGPAGAREPFPEAGGARPSPMPQPPLRGAGSRPGRQDLPRAGAGTYGRLCSSPFVAGLLGGAAVVAAVLLVRRAWSRRR